MAKKAGAAETEDVERPRGPATTDENTYVDLYPSQLRAAVDVPGKT